MVKKIYFDAPPGGLDSPPHGLEEARKNASASSPLADERFTFQQRGSDLLVVHYDDDGGAATQTSIDGLVKAIEAHYGVTHRRTVSEDG